MPRSARGVVRRSDWLLGKVCYPFSIKVTRILPPRICNRLGQFRSRKSSALENPWGIEASSIMTNGVENGDNEDKVLGTLYALHEIWTAYTYSYWEEYINKSSAEAPFKMTLSKYWTNAKYCFGSCPSRYLHFHLSSFQMYSESTSASMLTPPVPPAKLTRIF